jgi:hypothetical protein
MATLQRTNNERTDAFVRKVFRHLTDSASEIPFPFVVDPHVRVIDVAVAVDYLREAGWTNAHMSFVGQCVEIVFEEEN